MTWPIINDVSLLHLHTHRGKRSITLDLKSEEGVEVYKDLVRGADVVVEAMRPGSMARLGLGYDELSEVNPKLVFLTLSGYGATGPYKDLPSHGIAYDTWAGMIPPAYDDEGFCHIPEMPNIGINVGPMLAAVGLLAGIINARETGRGCQMEVAQSDAAAYMDWYRIETWKAYERPEDEVTGNAADDYERRAPGLAGMREGVRYQMYESADGHVLFMASEQAFWKNFCEGVGRSELFERWPGSKYADHARGNRELQAELRDIFKTRTSEEWLAFSGEANTPIAPGQQRQDRRRRPAVPGPLPVLRHRRRGRRAAAAPAEDGRRRTGAGAHDGADGGPAHRRGDGRSPGLRRARVVPTPRVRHLRLTTPSKSTNLRERHGERKCRRVQRR